MKNQVVAYVIHADGTRERITHGGLFLDDPIPSTPSLETMALVKKCIVELELGESK